VPRRRRPVSSSRIRCVVFRLELVPLSLADPAGGNFTGVFIGGPCPGIPYQLAGQIRGPRVVFQASRSYIAQSDCPVTMVASGRFVSPTAIATRWIATYAGPNGRPVRVRGEEIFQRI
jgi:hypothetical protein